MSKRVQKRVGFEVLPRLRCRCYWERKRGLPGVYRKSFESRYINNLFIHYLVGRSHLPLSNKFHSYSLPGVSFILSIFKRSSVEFFYHSLKVVIQDNHVQNRRGVLYVEKRNISLKDVLINIVATSNIGSPPLLGL